MFFVEVLVASEALVQSPAELCAKPRLSLAESGSKDQKMCAFVGFGKVVGGRIKLTIINVIENERVNLFSEV